LTLAFAAHAKLNLSLEVHGRRPDGLHEITSALQAISLHDLLIVEPAGRTELWGGQPNQDDLVLRAQRALEEAAGRPLPARFRLVKRIPVGAGMGGGSSDAAATLRALSSLYGLDLDLTPLAAGLGSDVSFFLQGGAALATGTGENLSPLPPTLPPTSGCYAIAWPGYPIPTASVYRAWDELGGEGDNQLTRAAVAVEPRLAGFVNKLEGWRMTGSGSAFFKPCQDRQHAERAVEAIRGLDCWTAVAAPVPAWGAPS
jgi:4-diphosphocytidyl-2-C-methyl-D-erythritol kinase